MKRERCKTNFNTLAFCQSGRSPGKDKPLVGCISPPVSIHAQHTAGRHSQPCGGFVRPLGTANAIGHCSQQGGFSISRIAGESCDVLTKTTADRPCLGLTPVGFKDPEIIFAASYSALLFGPKCFAGCDAFDAPSGSESGNSCAGQHHQAGGRIANRIEPRDAHQK